MAEVYPLRFDESKQSVILINGEPIDEELASAILSQLDELGILSGEAQFLKTPITTVEKWRSSDHILLCAVDMSIHKLLGYLKYGFKDLFFYSSKGALRQFRSPCLLDFYVLSDNQRSGLGKKLFDQMLACESQLAPNNFAYDRPSPKLLPFLLKHYQLSSPDAQPNNYTIYPGFLPADMR